MLEAIAATLNRASEVSEALSYTLSRLGELLGLDTGWVWLRDEDGRYYLAAAHNLPPYLEEPVRMTGQRCWCLTAFDDGELDPSHIDIMGCSRLAAAGRRHHGATRGLTWHASIPLYAGEQPLGVMNLTGRGERELSAHELDLLAAVGWQVGVAVERGQLAEERRRLARGEERARLAREIHDGLAQHLTAIGLSIEGAMSQLQASPAVAQQRLERALDLTRHALEEARRSMSDLRASELVGRPLAEALAALGRGFTAECGVPVRLLVQGEGPLPLPIEAELFRIAQEALANVRRHAKARLVEMRLEVGDDIRLRVRDDGVGWRGEEGHGVRGMRERAAVLGGRLRIARGRTSGTTVSVTLPWPT